MKINSDNAAIEKNLKFLEKSYEEYDGWLDPDLVITCQNGELGVEKHGLCDKNKPLIALPGELLLQTENLNISVKNDEIYISPDTEKTTDIQKKIADCMFDLYNLTDKIKNHQKSCCWFAYEGQTEQLEKLLAGRSLSKYQKEYLAFAKGERPDADRDQLLCDTYIKTRTIGHTQKDDEDEDDRTTTDIMPIVDFINHHHGGAPFNFKKGFDQKKKDREYLLLDDHRSLPDSNECFAYYNQLDALDSFISYGFPDAYAPYVRSIPVEIDIPDTGTIAFQSFLGGWRKGKLPQNLTNLRAFIPRTTNSASDTLTMSHLLIPTDNKSPHALRRVLRLVISNRISTHGKGKTLPADKLWQCVLDAEEKVINTNIDFYKSFLKNLETADPADANTQMLRYIANLQLTKIYKYSYDDSRASAEEDNSMTLEAAQS